MARYGQAFKDRAGARIVPALADEGVYLASESTFARVLREHGQSVRRGRAKAPIGAVTLNPELNQPDIRERFVYSYRLIYRVEPARILVTAVVHGKRLPDDATANRLAEK